MWFLVDEKFAGTAAGAKTREGQEVELESYGQLQQDGKLQRAGAGTPGGGSVHAELSASGRECCGRLRDREKRRDRQFVEASSNQLRVLCERRLEDLNLVVLMIDGIHFGGQVLVVALGIAEGGEKHVLGVWQGATENTTVVKGLLEDLVERGLDRQRRYLVVIDGSKALRAGVERVFGDQVEVQRCQIHKRRNVKEYLPGELPERLRSADAQCLRDEPLRGGFPEAYKKIFRQLERINPSAARSLEEGLEETLTVHRLGIGAVLRRKLATTNPIESCLSTVQRVARNVKRWREGNQPLRWTATGLLEAERKFRRIKGYQEILLLKERLNPSRIQQKEVRVVEVA